MHRVPFLLAAAFLVLAGACVGDDPAAPVDAGGDAATFDAGIPGNLDASGDAANCPVVTPETFNAKETWVPGTAGTQTPCVVDPRGDRANCVIQKDYSVLQRPFVSAEGTHRATFTVTVSALEVGKEIIVAQFRETGRARVEIHALATAAGVQITASRIANTNPVVLASGVAMDTATPIDVTWSGPADARAATFATGGERKTLATGDAASDTGEALFQLGPYDWKKDIEGGVRPAAVSYELPVFTRCD